MEYSMSREMAKMYLKNCPKNVRPQEFLCKIVNEQFGLRLPVVRVIVE